MLLLGYFVSYFRLPLQGGFRQTYLGRCGELPTYCETYFLAFFLGRNLLD